MLSGRVAVITGGASGIGRAIANRFAREGVRCVWRILMRRRAIERHDTFERTVEMRFERCDTSDEEAVKRLMSNTVSEFGALNILVNNAVSFVFGHMAGEEVRERNGQGDFQRGLGTCLERERVGLCSYDQACCTLHEARREDE